MTMQGKAIDVVIGELDKLAMCKRGTLQTERNERSGKIYKAGDKVRKDEPKFDKVERNKAFSKNRKRLLGILKFAKTKDMTFDNRTGSNLFTPESHAKFRKEKALIMIHPDHKDWAVTFRKHQDSYVIFNTEMEQREAILDDDFKQAKMDFISEKVSLKDFQVVYDELEQGVW